MIEKDFDIPFLAKLALHEKQIQQNYRPVIGVHKWFARRPGTLFRGLLLSEFGNGKLRDIFYEANYLNGITIADPFMGGGTPVIEANRLGCNVIGCDINPMAYWIVRRELASLDLQDYRITSVSLLDHLKSSLSRYYKTRCEYCGNEGVPVKYFIWVKTLTCSSCGSTIDLFPGYTLSTNSRHPRYVLICSNCGDLNEVPNPKEPGKCRTCDHLLKVEGPANLNRCKCPKCGTINKYPAQKQGPPVHRMIAIEYYCPHCKTNHSGRFFKKPDDDDLRRYQSAVNDWAGTRPEFVPDDIIPSGDETDRLHRWGYRRYSELFNDRQLLGLEMSCRFIASLPEGEIKAALSTNLSDLLRYQNMLCRYDTRALKSLDIFSVHGYPVGLIQCESNILGIVDGANEVNIGSGGWTNIIAKYIRAKEYCQKPFEFRFQNGKKVRVPINGESIGTGGWENQSNSDKAVNLYCDSSTNLMLSPASLDGVFTDPPYYGNIQYAELIDFCYVWLRRLVGDIPPGFQKASTRDTEELTGNNTMDRGIEHFLKGLSEVFQNMAQALKPGSPLVFTYHHNDLNAYLPIAASILDAGLVCSASLPCPAEMGGSIHINGTSSSIVDTVFICRSRGTVAKKTIASTPQAIAGLVLEDVRRLKAGGVKLSQGDIRCICFGHLTRLAIWFLRDKWERSLTPGRKLARITAEMERLGGWQLVIEYSTKNLEVPQKQHWEALEEASIYRGDDSEIAF